MKRSGHVGLVVMGVAAFGATFAGVWAYRAASAPPQGAGAAQPVTAAQACTTRPDGTQQCESTRRSFGYYLLPGFFHGSSSASSAPAARPAAQGAAFAGHAPAPAAAAAAAASPNATAPAARAQPAALTTSAPAAAPKPPPATLTYVARPTTSPSSTAQRGGFGATAQSKVRVSAGG